MLYLNICTLIHKRAHANADLHTHISLSIDLLYIYILTHLYTQNYSIHQCI